MEAQRKLRHNRSIIHGPLRAQLTKEDDGIDS
jgi:hypothetical protein